MALRDLYNDHRHMEPAAHFIDQYAINYNHGRTPRENKAISKLALATLGIEMNMQHTHDYLGGQLFINKTGSSTAQ